MTILPNQSTIYHIHYLFLNSSAIRRMPYNLSFRILFRVEEETINKYAKRTEASWDRPGQTGVYDHSSYRKTSLRISPLFLEQFDWISALLVSTVSQAGSRVFLCHFLVMLPSDFSFGEGQTPFSLGAFVKIIWQRTFGGPSFAYRYAIQPF